MTVTKTNTSAFPTEHFQVPNSLDLSSSIYVISDYSHTQHVPSSEKYFICNPVHPDGYSFDGSWIHEVQLKCSHMRSLSTEKSWCMQKDELGDVSPFLQPESSNPHSPALVPDMYLFLSDDLSLPTRLSLIDPFIEIPFSKFPPYARNHEHTSSS